MTILKILSAPHPVLKRKADHVDSVDDTIIKLIDDMLETMYHDNGVGLAANQVGVLKRIIVLDLGTSDDQEREADFYPLSFINPEIIHYSENKVCAQEGCLSLPDVFLDVERYESIEVKYINRHGEQKSLAAHGWLSRVIQHEIDHLNGVLSIDYLPFLKRSMTLKRLKKLQKASSKIS